MPYIEEKQDSRTMNWNSKSATTSRTYNMFDYPDTQDAILALGAYVPTDVPVATYLCVQPEYEVHLYSPILTGHFTKVRLLGRPLIYLLGVGVVEVVPTQLKTHKSLKTLPA